MHIRPFVTSDFIPLEKSTASAGDNDELLMVLFPHREFLPMPVQSYPSRALRALLVTPGTMTLVAETDPGDLGPNGEGIDEEGGKIVGQVTVERKGKCVVARKWRELYSGNWLERKLIALEWKYVNFFQFDRSADPDALREYGELMEPQGKLLEGGRFERMWKVHNLAVGLEYHRRGVGKMLMDWVMRQAENEGVPIGLSSSAMGRKLYERLGFEVLGETMFRGVQGGTTMAWFPKKAAGQEGDK